MKEVIQGNPELELPPKERLATPHFDDMAIAEARPVQPLPQRPESTFRILTPRKLSMLIAATAVLIAVVGLSIGTNSKVDPAQPATAEVESAEVESAEVESKAEPQASEKLVDSQPTLERRGSVSRRNLRSTKVHRYFFESPAYGSFDGKPVPRKVGVIRN